jgi:hypothetical protein
MIINRLIKFDGELAIFINENNEKSYILKKDLPKDAKDGDIIYVDHFGNFRIDIINSRKNKSRTV